MPVKAGGRALEGKPQVWSLMGLSRLQKTVMEATRIPERRWGESSDPMVMKARMAIPALMTSDRLHNAT